RGFELALDQEPHAHRRGMPAARSQALENRIARGGFIEMEGLRVELRREGLDLVLLDREPAGAEFLPDGIVLDVSAAHGISAPAFRARARCLGRPRCRG